MAEQTDFGKMKSIGDLRVGDEPIFLPLKNYKNFDEMTLMQMNQLDENRDEKKERVLGDVKDSPHLKRMDIVQDALGYIETTELIDSIFAQQKNICVDIIEEMIKVVDDKYVLKKEYLRLKKIYDEKQVKSIDVADNKIDAMLKTVKDDIEEKMKSGLNKNQLSGIRLRYFSKVQANDSFTTDEKKQLMLDISKLVSGYYDKLKNQDVLEATEGTVQAETESSVQ